MGGASSYASILCLTLFLVAVWAASKLSRLIGMSSIVTEIATGLLLGPQVLDFLPFEYSHCHHRKVTDCSSREDQLAIASQGAHYCDLGAYLTAGKYAEPWESGFWGGESSTVDLGGETYHLDAGRAHRRLDIDDTQSNAAGRHLTSGGSGGAVYSSYSMCLEQSCILDLAYKCGATPDILTVVGHTGVALMIFESGMHFDFEQAKTVGLPACAVALMGTLLPLATGTGIVMAFGFPFLEGFSAGTALAPTSVGIALRLLHEAKSLQTYFGQAIITAAFVDDILSLILYNILFSLKGELTFQTFLPLILGIVFMLAAAAAGAKLWPKILTFVFSKIPERKPDAKLTTHHEILFALMLVVLLVYAQITHLCGTHLWGCFIAGMSFAMWREAHHVWVRQTKRITCWMIRIFFSASVAFTIPVEELLSVDAFWKGAIMGIGPCILTKVLCAPFMGDARFVIGWAMVGRAEFAYLIAQMAAASNMMGPSVFSIVIWALLWATIVAPTLFRVVLKRYIERKAAEEEEEFEQDNIDDIDQEKAAAGVRATARGATLGHLPDIVGEELSAQLKMDQVRLQMRLAEVDVENQRLRERNAALERQRADWEGEVAKWRELVARSGGGSAEDGGLT